MFSGISMGWPWAGYGLAISYFFQLAIGWLWDAYGLAIGMLLANDWLAISWWWAINGLAMGWIFADYGLAISYMLTFYWLAISWLWTGYFDWISADYWLAICYLSADYWLAISWPCPKITTIQGIVIYYCVPTLNMAAWFPPSSWLNWIFQGYIF